MDLNFPPGRIAPELHAQLERDLVAPALEFMGRARKAIRKKLVAAGFEWSRESAPKDAESSLCEQLGQALEMIHSASLIIDDIQDASKERRGAAAMHVSLGLPKAINLGNWLYFQGLEHLDTLDVSDDQRLRLLRLFRRTLVNGHIGQALDLGVPMAATPKTLVRETSETSIRLKTGALTGLAFAGGALLAGADLSETERAFAIGEEVGLILQAYDDLKNLKQDPQAEGKRFEDLKNQRPGLVWSIAANHPDPECWNELIRAAQALPDGRALTLWLERFTVFDHGAEWIESRVRRLRGQFARPGELEIIIKELRDAYEKL